MHQSVDFCVQNVLKLAFEHIQVKKFFRLAGTRHEGRKKEGRGKGERVEWEREGMGGNVKGEETMGRDRRE